MDRHSYPPSYQDTSTDTQQARLSLAKNGRSFFWASKLLGTQMTDNAARLYMFCRLLDDLADGDLPEGADRLCQIRASLMALRDGQNPPVLDPDLRAFMPLITSHNLCVTSLIHLLDGLLFDQGTVAIKDEAALIVYAYQVAGTVGQLICPILGCDDKRADAFAVDMGIAMQLTNIARDVYEDACLGRRYLPESWTGPLSPIQIKQAAEHPQSPAYQRVQSGIRRLLDLADRYYHSAEPGLSFLPLRAHLSIAVAGRVYAHIGKKLVAGNFNWAAGRTTTNNAEKLVATIGALPLLRYRNSKLPVHDPSLHSALETFLENRKS